jgi:hypothetical protein
VFEARGVDAVCWLRVPLHDSVLVARSHAETAKTFMEQEFMHRSGSPRAFVKIDFGPN